MESNCLLRRSNWLRLLAKDKAMLVRKVRKRFLALLGCALCFLLAASEKHLTTIFVIGDSTAAEKSHPETNPERGWGMVLQGFFDDKILVDNHAVNGRSSKSFIDEGRWQKVLDKIQPGDYVFIQFGHNDEKPHADRHTEPGTTFDANLKRFVAETREKGGMPVLFNPVVRRCYYVDSVVNDDDEKLRKTVFEGEEKLNSDTLVDTHGAYAVVPRQVAQEMNVPFVDATKLTHDIETNMGIVGSRKLHVWYKPGEIASIPKGRMDNTHYNIYGARVVAGALVDAIGEQVPALKKHIRHYDYVVSSMGRGNYMTLQDAVDAVPIGGKATILVLGGEWEKPMRTEEKNIKYLKYWGANIK